MGLLVFLATCTIVVTFLSDFDFGRHSAGETKFANESHLFPDRLGSRTDCVGDELRVDCPAGGIRSATTHLERLATFYGPGDSRSPRFFIRDGGLERRFT